MLSAPTLSTPVAEPSPGRMLPAVSVTFPAVPSPVRTAVAPLRVVALAAIEVARFNVPPVMLVAPV